MAKTPAKSASPVSGGKPHPAHKSNGAKKDAKDDSKSGAKNGAKKAVKPAPGRAKAANHAPAAKSQAKPAAKPAAKPVAKPVAKPAAKPAPRPAAAAANLPSNAAPKLKGKAEKPAPIPKPRKPRPDADAKIVHLIAEEMAIEEAELTANASFKEDLNLDEIDVAELLMQAETTFGVHPFNEEDWESCETVGDFTRMVGKRLEAKRKK